MADLFMLGVAGIFFFLTVLFVRLCAWMMRGES